ncbi:MAG: sulfatase-like hydrolase/transferase, partial [Gemmatimonadetes bacterium]|nr:sulfatase-like hydrolase/transferase [Gemmatimonadota bacterium]
MKPSRVAVALGGCAVGALLLAGCGRSDGPPGLILVTIDTCRADRIGCYGAGGEITPVIDGLAERGVVFEQATAPAPLTLPSHCTILTGLYPDRHTLRDNGVGRLPDGARTLAEILSDAGWRTGAFVSAVPLGSEFGADQGFAAYDDEFSSSAAGLVVQSESEREVADRLFFEERIASRTVDAAAPWIREARAADEPYFAWIHFFDPHAVYSPPPAQAARFGAGSYEGEIAFVDEQIGRILEEIGDLSGVVVAVTADHGESLGDHGEQSHGLFVYESTLRVPWVLAGPGVPRGTRVADPVSLVDVTPTLLEVLGLPGLDDVDGASRLAAAQGDAAADADVFGECLLPRLNYNWAGLRSVRRGRWKLIDAPAPELYDLANDPGETRNVAGDHPDQVAQLRAALEAHYARGGELPAEAAGIDPEVREQLERLGYVGVRAADKELPDDTDLWNPEGRDPKDMVDFFNRFQNVPTMMMDGRNEEAGRTLTELRAEDPQNLKVLERLAMLRRAEERWSDVAALCREILELAPDDARMRKNLAYAQLQLGETEAALDGYRAFVAATPEDPEAWALLGSVLSEAGQHEEALTALRQAAKLAPEDPELRVGVAQAHEEAGDTAAALAEYDRALAQDPSASAALNGKGLLLSHTGRVREAADVLRGGLPGVGEDLDTLNNLAWILANERIDPEEAYRYATRARALAPD